MGTLLVRDWSLPNGLISDRDARFISEFWVGVCKSLKTRMVTSAAFHPQTDGQSERSNQTVEIALGYDLTSNPSSR